MITFPNFVPEIVVEQDRTCTVSLATDYGFLAAKGLTPEQATNLKQMLIAAHARGRHQALFAVSQAIAEAKNKIVFG